MNILISTVVVLLALFLLGLCIFIHELGHFLVALWRGMYIERFSIGFGRKIWGCNFKNVEFIVSILPFGGYVALPQLEPTEEPADKHGNPLPQASPTDRILTAIAGPLSNVLLGFLLAGVLWGIKVERPMPVKEYSVVSVEQGSPEYKAGLRPSDVIVGINGEAVPNSRNRLLEKIILGDEIVSLTVRKAGVTEKITYKKKQNPDAQENLPFPFFKVKIPVSVLRVRPGSPADRAGLQKGDRFISVDGEKVKNPRDFVERIREKDGKPVTITVERGDEKVVFSDIKPLMKTVNDKNVPIIGVAPGVPLQLVRVSPWAQFVDVMVRTRNTLKAVLNPDSGVGARHMSGPVGIVNILYQMFMYQGVRGGLSLLVLVSFNLALLNILPIPVLDGGHVVYGLIEGLSGRRIPTKPARIIQTVFAVLLISFILYVTAFDINRTVQNLFGGDKESENQEEQQN
ncbi:MAG: RIP metalloprotease RseP [Lentisphaeria bacterium]